MTAAEVRRIDNQCFSLLDEPWIPCRDAAGRSVELGLRDTLVRAHELASIVASSPLTTFALHRLLLALLYRVHDGPRTLADWSGLWRRGRFDPSMIDAYLDRWRTRFDLYDEGHPFFQVAGFQTGTASDPKPTVVAALALEHASGNNATLFDHTLEADARWEPAAECARRLVTTQAWALGGGKGPTSVQFGAHPYASHAPCVGGVVTLVEGDTLFFTLALNLARLGDEGGIASGPEDQPAWERPRPRAPGPAEANGLLDYLTWPSRYLRLLPERTVQGLGSRRLFLAPGLAFARDGGLPPDPAWTLLVVDPGGHGDPVLKPLGVRVGRAVWRDAHALLAARARPGRNDLRAAALRQLSHGRVRQGLLEGPRPRLRLRCIGLANDKAKAILWVNDVLPAPLRLLDAEQSDLQAALAAALDQVERVGRALWDALGRMSRAVLETPQKPADRDEVKRVRDALERAHGFWGAVGARFPDFLSGLVEADEAVRDERRAAWVDHACREAERALADAAAQLPGGLDRVLRARVAGEEHLRNQLAALRRELTTAVEEGRPA